MWQRRKSILLSTLVMAAVMAWSIAEVSPAFAKRGGGRSGSGGSVSRGGMSRGPGVSRGGMSRGGGISPGGRGFSRGGSISRRPGSFSRGGSLSPGGRGFSRGGSISRRPGSFSRGGSLSPGGRGFSRGGSISRGGGSIKGRDHGYSRGGTVRRHYGDPKRHGHSSFYFRPYGHRYYRPGLGIYHGLPTYRYYDYDTYYDVPYYSGYTRPYVEEYRAVDSTSTARTTPINGPVIPASGGAADFQLQAERAFREHRYEDAARLSNHAIVEDGQNGKLHLFASQTLFALGDFRPAAAAVQQAAALLEPSDWGFVVENYQKFYRGDDYATQTDRLIDFIKEKPGASYAHFLLGYHYLFLGHNEAASKHLAKAVGLESRDRLAAELLAMADGSVPITAEETMPTPAAPPNQKQ